MLKKDVYLREMTIFPPNDVCTDANLDSRLECAQELLSQGGSLSMAILRGGQRFPGLLGVIKEAKGDQPWSRVTLTPYYLINIPPQRFESSNIAPEILESFWSAAEHKSPEGSDVRTMTQEEMKEENFNHMVKLLIKGMELGHEKLANVLLDAMFREFGTWVIEREVVHPYVNILKEKWLALQGDHYRMSVLALLSVAAEVTTCARSEEKSDASEDLEKAAKLERVLRCLDKVLNHFSVETFTEYPQALRGALLCSIMSSISKDLLARYMSKNLHKDLIFQYTTEHVGDISSLPRSLLGLALYYHPGDLDLVKLLVPTQEALRVFSKFELENHLMPAVLSCVSSEKDGREALAYLFSLGARQVPFYRDQRFIGSDALYMAHWFMVKKEKMAAFLIARRLELFVGMPEEEGAPITAFCKALSSMPYFVTSQRDENKPPVCLSLLEMWNSMPAVRSFGPISAAILGEERYRDLSMKYWKPVDETQSGLKSLCFGGLGNWAILMCAAYEALETGQLFGLRVLLELGVRGSDFLPPLNSLQGFLSSLPRSFDQATLNGSMEALFAEFGSIPVAPINISVTDANDVKNAGGMLEWVSVPFKDQEALLGAENDIWSKWAAAAEGAAAGAAAGYAVEAPSLG